MEIGVKDFIVFTVSSNMEDYEKYIKKCISDIKGLESDFMFGNTKTNIAHELNSFMKNCKHRFVIFCHQDVVFSNDLIDVYKKFYSSENIGAAGIIGKGFDNLISFGSDSSEDRGYKVDYVKDIPKEVSTLDSCLVIIDKHQNVLFDEKTFNGLHCFVEDFCCSQRYRGKKVLVLPLKNSNHIGTTTKSLGCNWGNYLYFKSLLFSKWSNKISVNLC